MIASRPILSCDEARALEAKLFAGDEAKEWAAMQQAGRAVAAGVLKDFEEIGGFPADGRMLVLVGKGHNGGDALIAAQAILEKFPTATAEVEFVFGERALRPLAARAWRELAQAAGGRVHGSAGGSPAVFSEAGEPPALPGYDLCLDGIFGFQFRPPADERLRKVIEKVNALPIRSRAAIDLPSADLFRADFTYATGAVKTPVIASENAGRIRFLELGFFEANTPGKIRVLTPEVLAPLAGLRSSHSDKRDYGQVFVLGGSRNFPGAILMSVRAALHSGVGLLTAFVPESLVSAYAAQVPEAMWVGWPETPAGGLALEGLHLLRERIARADALVIGPGLGRETETLALIEEIVKTARVPVVLDADALQPQIVSAAKTQLVLTPHAGEFERIAGEVALEKFAREHPAIVVLKGPVTRITAGEEVYHSFFGGPVLARGGSGDMLAGIIGGLLAQTPEQPLLAAARGVVWHGVAADALARARGQVAVHATELLEFLGVALRGCAGTENPAAPAAGYEG